VAIIVQTALVLPLLWQLTPSYNGIDSSMVTTTQLRSKPIKAIKQLLPSYCAIKSDTANTLK